MAFQFSSLKPVCEPKVTPGIYRVLLVPQPPRNEQNEVIEGEPVLANTINVRWSDPLTGEITESLSSHFRFKIVGTEKVIDASYLHTEKNGFVPVINFFDQLATALDESASPDDLIVMATTKEFDFSVYYKDGFRNLIPGKVYGKNAPENKTKPTVTAESFTPRERNA